MLVLKYFVRLEFFLKNELAVPMNKLCIGSKMENRTMSTYGSFNNTEYRAPILDSSSARAVGVERYFRAATLVRCLVLARRGHNSWLKPE